MFFFSGNHAVIIFICPDWQCRIFDWNSYPFPVELSGISDEILISCCVHSQLCKVTNLLSFLLKIVLLVIGRSLNSEILRLLYKYLLNQFQIKRVAKVYSNHDSYRILFTVTMGYMVGWLVVLGLTAL